MKMEVKKAAETADVVIMGAGIIGLCNALMYAKQNIK